MAAVKKSEFDIDSVISKLLNVPERNSSKAKHLTEYEIKSLCLKSIEILLSQPTLLELSAPLNICGNIDGQYCDLLRIFEVGGFPPKSHYLFLGDYVDQGKQSIETICLLLAYKVKYPYQMYLIRGNHECESVYYQYGFYDECKRRYNMKLWKIFNGCFNCLPVAAIIGEKVFCCHGGLSPELQSMEQLKHIRRPIDVPDDGLLCDLLWSDPDEDISGWGLNKRGKGFTFGPDIVKNFVKRHKFDLICRGDTALEYGYQFFAEKYLVTLCSAPNYSGDSTKNGAIMYLDSELICSFRLVKPAKLSI